MKPKVLILSSTQFGYLTDTLKYCEYASEKFEITYLGWDHNGPKIELPGAHVKYVSRRSNLLVRNLRLLRSFHEEIRKGYDVIFSNYVRGISIVRLLNIRVKFILDVRTMSVKPQKLGRLLYDILLKIEVFFFDHVSVINREVAHKLKLKSYFLLPLGGECFVKRSRSFEKLSFLYVGTLENRNIIDCVKAFHLYLQSLNNYESAPSFIIVGSSPQGELSELIEYITRNNLNDYIQAVGAVPQGLLAPYFEKSNIGVSYVPITPYFTHQPPTKTFEYLISGLPVIATATEANKQLLNSESGVLIEDNVESFFNGMVKLHSDRKRYSSDKIQDVYKSFKWERVVEQRFVQIINMLLHDPVNLNKPSFENS